MVTSGCSTAEGTSPPTAEVSDSLGVRIITYDLTDVAIPTYRMVAGHDLQIGVQDGPPEYTLSRIADLTVADDGSFVVADGLAHALRVYDVEGTYRLTLGQQGGGPGEFAAVPTIAGLAGDTVFAFDARSRRVTVFATDGRLLGMTSLQSEDAGRPQALIRKNDGTYFSQSRWVDRSGQVQGPHEARMELDSIAIEHLDATGELLDTVRVMADQHRGRVVQDRGGPSMAFLESPIAYAARAFMRSDGLRLIVGRSNSFELELLGPAEEVETILRVLGVQHPATGGEIKTRQEGAVREALGDGPINPLIWKVNVEFLPDRLPAFGSVIISDGGDIWVSLTEFDGSEGFEWLVFTPNGELRGVVDTPDGLQLFAVRTQSIVGVYRDDLGVPYVQRYPLHFGPEGD